MNTKDRNEFDDSDMIERATRKAAWQNGFWAGATVGLGAAIAAFLFVVLVVV